MVFKCKKCGGKNTSSVFFEFSNQPMPSTWGFKSRMTRTVPSKKLQGSLGIRSTGNIRTLTRRNFLYAISSVTQWCHLVTRFFLSTFYVALVSRQILVLYHLLNRAPRKSQPRIEKTNHFVVKSTLIRYPIFQNSLIPISS